MTAELSWWGRRDPQQRCIPGGLISSRPQCSEASAAQGAASPGQPFLPPAAGTGREAHSRPDARARASSLPEKPGHPRKCEGAHTQFRSRSFVKAEGSVAF